MLSLTDKPKQRNPSHHGGLWSKKDHENKDTGWPAMGKPALGKVHQQKIIPSGLNGSVRVDTVWERHQRHPCGGLRHAWRQYHASRCISASHGSFTIPSCSVGHLFQRNTLVLKANCDDTSAWVHWARACIGIAMRWVTLRKYLLAFLLPACTMHFSLY